MGYNTNLYYQAYIDQYLEYLLKNKYRIERLVQREREKLKQDPTKQNFSKKVDDVDVNTIPLSIIYIFREEFTRYHLLDEEVE